MQKFSPLSDLPDYAFPRLRRLLQSKKSSEKEIFFHIGEPCHKFPDFIKTKIIDHLDGFNHYPPNEGSANFLSAAANWLERRYNIPKPDFETNLIALNGTREGLFNSALALSQKSKNGEIPAILIPNPFYQCYMVAAKASGAEPIFVPATRKNNFFPDFSKLPVSVLNRVTLCYICSPSNPQGAVASRKYWKNLFNLAERFDFKILADECYSEIYREKQPSGALENLHIFDANPERLVIFNSLSKRSNLPGLRSGFAAGGKNTIAELKKLKAYCGAPCPTPLQHAAAAAWNDEAHVEYNRKQYSKKLEIADILFQNLPDYQSPEAGFFLWLRVNNDEKTTIDLWEKFGVKVLPGSYLSQENHSSFNCRNPGIGYIRIALVRSEDEIKYGLSKIADYLMH